MSGQQAKQGEWLEEWSLFQDDERFLFEDWIRPATLADLRGKDVLECGCGGGQHTLFMSEVAKSVTAVDLNTIEVARRRVAHRDNVAFIEADLATMDLGRQFDVVVCIGVIHHTDDPTATFHNLYRHCKPGGRLIIWTYSAEGNELVRFVVEPVRKLLLRKLSRKAVMALSYAITASLYPIVYTLYRLPPARALPYFEYFANFRRLNYERNTLNVFDKLNAPQTRFTTRAKCDEWFSPGRFDPDSIYINFYVGVSYSLVGVKQAS
jgi:SAM-dependent methyltransferase